MNIKYDEKFYLCLDKLRESGVTNMYGAASYLQSVYPDLTKKEAREILGDWMDTFGDRHPRV